jgi:hypothetical protein
MRRFSSHQSLATLAVVALALAAGFLPFSGSARAADADCQRPPSQTAVFGCVWTGSYFTGTMTVYEGTGRNATTGCFEGSPRSAVNNTPATGHTRYVFRLYHHPGCESGGKAFGVLPPQQGDPDLPDVQSYAWTKFS